MIFWQGYALFIFRVCHIIYVSMMMKFQVIFSIVTGKFLFRYFIWQVKIQGKCQETKQTSKVSTNLRKQSARRNATFLWHMVLTIGRPFFVLTLECCKLNGEAANILILMSLVKPGRGWNPRLSTLLIEMSTLTITPLKPHKWKCKSRKICRW